MSEPKRRKLFTSELILSYIKPNRYLKAELAKHGAINQGLVDPIAMYLQIDDLRLHVLSYLDLPSLFRACLVHTCLLRPKSKISLGLYGVVQSCAGHN